MSDLAYMLPAMGEGDKPLVWPHGEIKTPPISAYARLEAGHLLRRLSMTGLARSCTYGQGKESSSRGSWMENRIDRGIPRSYIRGNRLYRAQAQAQRCGP